VQKPPWKINPLTVFEKNILKTNPGPVFIGKILSLANALQARTIFQSER
jgi:hypothetical protein